MWQSLMCLVVACSYKNVDRDILRGEAVTVTSVLHDPYLRLKDASLEGNEKYEGFFKDLMDAIGNVLGFSFNINLTEDSRYGACVDYGRNPANGNCEAWTGLVGDVVSGNADLAVADLTITPDRLMALDFTQPIINSGLVVMTKSDVEAETVEDLIAQGFTFMMNEGGATQAYISRSSDSTIIKLWKNSKGVQNNEVAVDLMLNSSANYAVLMEHTSNRYHSQDCRLKIVGEPLNSIGYGLAMAKGVAKKGPNGAIGLRTILDYAIAKVKQDGTVARLEDKWWPKRNC